MNMKEEEIVEILADTGPLTGAELVEKTRTEVLLLWQICRRSPAIRLEITGSRFLRLDRVVQGYARLSPSIRREFLTYTLVGLNSQAEALGEESEKLKQETERISRAKLALAGESIESAVAALPDKEIVLEKACFIIAGDVVYGMSHTVPRPEKSTDEMVHGSDLDIVVVVEDDLGAEIVDSLDRCIHKRKHLLLVNNREEIDYLIKSMSRVREQLRFDIFSSMVACKILDEGKLLCGSAAAFRTVKDLVVEHGIPQRLADMERQAAANRELAEARLLELGAREDESEYYSLFYTQAEGDEIY